MTQTIRTSVAGPSGSRRLFAARDSSLAAHLERFGPMPGDFDEGHLIAEVEGSGLAGRGGAGFPAWRKLMAASTASAAIASATSSPAARRLAKAGGPVVIANGAEGEPLSRKDETLLRAAPHLVLDGLLLAAATVRATEVFVYTTAASLPSVSKAIGERGDAAHVRLFQAPETFLSGEATAVVNAIGGGAAIPRDHIARMTSHGPSVGGLRGRPTLVQNVETLAHLALIARFGATWFRSIGRDGETGTRLVSVSGDVPSPLVFETEAGAPLSDTLLAAGVVPDQLRAVLVGGYHGAWVPSGELRRPLSRDSLAPFGAAPGAGILMALGTERCGLEASAEIATYLAGQSAKQCGPCANGLPRLADVLRRLAAREQTPWLPAEVERLALLVQGRGSCHHPDGTSRLVLSTLTVFAADVAQHLQGRCEVHA
ncbi:NADH-ubiquinone oxidoreductase-F iron-sulfur binding region domain-containing protein [Frondihabitans cladoniiphilus]|uniref:NADH-ubiquinone oxidoreductase-F iron-sulfur binding region domain-containing protein n=1 Tax=Frondihabitans cladoniiphilus TaxID=715785 RepID=A0ABP8W383_9MICO